MQDPFFILVMRQELQQVLSAFSFPCWNNPCSLRLLRGPLLIQCSPCLLVDSGGGGKRTVQRNPERGGGAWLSLCVDTHCPIESCGTKGRVEATRRPLVLPSSYRQGRESVESGCEDMMGSPRPSISSPRMRHCPQLLSSGEAVWRPGFQADSEGPA